VSTAKQEELRGNMGSDVHDAEVAVDGLDEEVELQPVRAVAAIAVVAGAAILSVIPAAIVLGVARLQLEELAAGLGGLAAVVGGVKLLVAVSGIAGRVWSEHTARLATTQAG
jgi:hypothetical protein